MRIDVTFREHRCREPRCIAHGRSYWTFLVSLSGLPALAAPSNLTAVRSGSLRKQRIALSWTDNSSSEARFVIERSTTSSFSSGTTKTFTVPANTTSYTDGALQRRTTYYYRVFAEDSTSTRSAPSNVVSVTTT
jgi:hypothetical protein